MSERVLGVAAVALVSSVLACSPLAHQRQEIDLLIQGGRVLTMVEGASGDDSAVAVDQGLILEVGGEELTEIYEARQTVDLAGRALLPGFIDTHTHIRGESNRYLNLTEVTSIASIQQRVVEKAAELGPGEWITGYGWSEDELEEQRRPLRSDLDTAAPDNPVVLTRAGGHSANANSMALALAGLDRSTPDPEGGVIERDENGELNGVIRERQDLVTRLVPEATNEELTESLTRNLKDQFRHGITSLVQAMESIEGYARWQEIYAQSQPLPRASVQLRWVGQDEFDKAGLEYGQGDEHLRVGPIKIMVDGGFTGPAAYTLEPYRGTEQTGESGYRGKMNLTVEQLRSGIRGAHENGWQLGIHAIGDAAIELTVDELAAALADHPRDDHRHYLNHFTVMPPEATMVKMAENDIAITQQPNFTYTLEGRYVANLDGDRLEHNNALRTPMSYGIQVAISSDILPIGPLVGIEAAVTRQGMSGRIFGESEALEVIEALHGYTRLAAYLTFEEDEKGTLEPSKFADFVVLSDDPMSVEPENLSELEVEMTFLAGEQVYPTAP